MKNILPSQITLSRGKRSCSRRRNRRITSVVFLSLLAIISAVPGYAANETILHSFTGKPDGAFPYSNLIIAKGGVLFGTTNLGGLTGIYGAGTVFEVTPPTAPGGTWTTINLYNFTGGADGGEPMAGLVADKHGRLYGTTSLGGTNCESIYSCGTVYELLPPATPGGDWSIATLYTFSGALDGVEPEDSLIVDDSGNLYGTAVRGGSLSYGTVFELSPPTTIDKPWTETILYNFGGGGDGAYPQGKLLAGENGKVYGTTTEGGRPSGGAGTVFELTPPTVSGGIWTEKVIHAFPGGSDGATPYAGLIADKHQTLFGITRNGGGSTNCLGGCGIVFSLTPPAAPGDDWTEAILHSFNPNNSGSPDGAFPTGSLLLDNQGKLYGNTNGGGDGPCIGRPPNGCGTVFVLKPPATSGGVWTESVFSFDGISDADGEYPAAGLVGRDGVLYGTTLQGGGFSKGTVFELTP